MATTESPDTQLPNLQTNSTTRLKPQRAPPDPQTAPQEGRAAQGGAAGKGSGKGWGWLGTHPPTQTYPEPPGPATADQLQAFLCWLYGQALVTAAEQHGHKGRGCCLSLQTLEFPSSAHIFSARPRGRGDAGSHALEPQPELMLRLQGQA